MIQGEFGDDDELLFPIELITDEGLELEVNAMLDTGAGLTKILLGRQWLKTRRLVVDMLSGVLTLGS